MTAKAEADSPQAVYGRTHDGQIAARVGPDTYALVIRNGQPMLGSRLRDHNEALAQLDSKQFDFMLNALRPAEDPEAAFKAAIEELAQHQRQLACLQRQTYHPKTATPWGKAQEATRYATGVVFYTTSGHGGFHLSAARNGLVHPSIQNNRGWYEEDVEWAAVANSFPELFTNRELRYAHDTIRDYFPQAYEAIHQCELAFGQSKGKDENILHQRHQHDLIVISAIISSHNPGMVECIAVRGGRAAMTPYQDADEYRYLVPQQDYKIGKIGFIIDEAKYPRYDGPSDFIGYRQNG